MEHALPIIPALVLITILVVVTLFSVMVPGVSSIIPMNAKHTTFCTDTQLIVSIHSFEQQRIIMNNITIENNNAECDSNVPYLILNTKSAIICFGEFEKGELYTLVFGEKGLRVRC